MVAASAMNGPRSGLGSALMVTMMLSAALACSSSSDEPPPPPYNALFDPLPAATPNKLRGVWGVTQPNAEGPAELRFRFSEGMILAGTRCTYTRPGFEPLIAGKSGTAEIVGLDEANGSFTPNDGLNFLAKPDARVCQGALAKDTYDFAIKDTTLTLTVKNKTGTLVFDKVGD